MTGPGAVTNERGLSLRGAAASHTGLVRSHNEDSGFAGPGLVLVADGVGGHAAGEVASATAAHVVSASALADPAADPVATLRRAVRQAQGTVAQGSQDPSRRGMATTLTAVLADGDRFALAHLGDSRAYLLRGGGLSRLTRDHTAVQDLLDAGLLAPQDAPGHRWSHVVTRILRGDPDEEADVVPLGLRAGDRLLLCSDGLTDLVDDERLAGLLRRTPDDAAVVDALLDEALRAGGRDNVTCVVATVVPGRPARREGRLVGAARDPRLAIDAAAVRLRPTA